MKKQTKARKTIHLLAILLAVCLLAGCGSGEGKTGGSLKNTVWMPEAFTIGGVVIEGGDWSGRNNCKISFDESGNMSFTMWGVTWSGKYQADTEKIILDAEAMSGYSIERDGDCLIVTDKVTGNKIRFVESSGQEKEKGGAGNIAGEQTGESDRETGVQAGVSEEGSAAVSLTGTWEPSGFVAGGVKVENPYMAYINHKLTFREDGTVKAELWGLSYESEYSLDENGILIEIPSVGEVHIKIQDGILEMEDSKSGGGILFAKNESQQ